MILPRDKNVPIIDDANWSRASSAVVGGRLRGKGCLSMSAEPGYEGSNARPFEESGIDILTDEQIKDIALDLQKQKARIKDVWLESGMKSYDQGRTNYCWIFCCISGMTWIVNVHTGQQIRISPTSAGARIKNGANVGGWPSEGVRHMMQHGCNLASEWPINDLSMRHNTTENKRLAKRLTVVEAFFLTGSKRQQFRQMLSAAVQGWGCAAGFNWWRHAIWICDVDPDSLDPFFLNSWGTGYGDQGFGRLSGSKREPDGGVVVKAVKMSHFSIEEASNPDYALAT